MESHIIATVNPNYENGDYSQNVDKVCDYSSYYEIAYSLFPRDGAVF
jgi:hypothetical protein